MTSSLISNVDVVAWHPGHGPISCFCCASNVCNIRLFMVLWLKWDYSHYVTLCYLVNEAASSLFSGPCLKLLLSCSVVSNSLQPHGLQHARLPCPPLFPRAYSNSCPLSQWCRPTISPSVIPFFSCLQMFPAPRCFPVSQFFASGGQSIGASVSASVLPKNILDLTGLISLLSKGLSSVCSSTTVQMHQFMTPSLLYSPTLTSIHDYWKNHSFDYTDLCRQSNVSAF